MAAGPSETIWPAAPHTIAKIDILEAYLVAYFQILGRTRPNQDLLYIDGFAGPNQYKNHPFGSPTAALNAASIAVVKSDTAWKAGRIHFAFVEQDKMRYENMLRQLSRTSTNARFQIHPYNMEFTEALPLIKQKVPEPFHSNNPLFAFIDPFGATGVPFDSVAEILNSPCSEVLINLNAVGVSRIFAAKAHANHVEVLTKIFGDVSWEMALNDDQSFDTQCRNVLHLYKNRLNSLPDVKYIYEVEMQGSTRTLNYFLVFASKHHKGLIKMKEAMGSIAQNGTFKFIDANVGQIALFGPDEPVVYQMKLHEAFKGQKVAFNGESDEITAFALNYTPFTSAKTMLKRLEMEKMVTAYSAITTRQVRISDKTVVIIHFHERVQNGFEFED